MMGIEITSQNQQTNPYTEKAYFSKNSAHILRASFKEDIVMLDSLHKDMSYQRPVSTSRLAKMKPYNLDLAGSVDVNRRSDGSLWILDGGHRVELARKAGEIYIFAHVFSLSTVALEALYFEQRNKYMKPPTALQRLRALIVASDRRAVQLEEIVRETGYELDDTRSANPNGISCAHALQLINERSPEELADVLHLIRDTWGNAHGAVAEPMVMAVSMFVRKYHGKYDHKRFVQKLSQYEPDVLNSRAIQLAALRSGYSSEKLLFEVLVDYYDNYLRSNRLREKTEEE